MNIRQIIAGNWKMTHTKTTGAAMLTQLVSKLQSPQAEIIIFPPFTGIDSALKITQNSPITIGAQTLHQKHEGAFTGEISGAMIQDLGCTHVLIGHSERRQYNGETNQDTQEKLDAAFKNTLIPILCVGETLAQRDANQTFTHIEKQLTEGLASTPKTATFIIAYEPVWAIGTGKVATTDQAQEVHAFIRQTLLKQGFPADRIPILYGGSVKPDNAKDLLSQPDINGALVGGASLEAESFAKIIESSL